MSNPLLDRQASLLEYLTSAQAIYANTGDRPFDDGPHHRLGIDRGLLHLEARYSHDKRMAKIKWVLQRTFELLGSDQERIVRDFTDACPPTGIGRLENARQFHDFLKVRWQNDVSSEPSYLPDLASFELAYAAVRGEDDAVDAPAQNTGHGRSGTVRRNPRAILMRCAHDIRPVLEDRHGEGTVAWEESRFALSLPRGSAEPVIIAVSEELFAVLEALDDFTDPDIVEDMLGSSEFVAEFVANGLLEISP
jgi:hypothetical protein